MKYICCFSKKNNNIKKISDESSLTSVSITSRSNSSRTSSISIDEVSIHEKCKICWSKNISPDIKCIHLLCDSCLDKIKLYYKEDGCVFCNNNNNNNNNNNKTIF